MAKRRALARALAGLGQGIANASNLWMHQLGQERMQDRYDERQEKSIKAQAARANDAEIDRVSREIRMKVAAGEIEPAAAAVMLSQLAPERGNVDAAALEPIRPSLAKRIGKKFDPLMDAQFPEGLPTDQEIATFVKGDGGMVPGALDIPMSADTPTGTDPFSMLTNDAGAAARDYASGVGARRRSLMSRPTEKVTKEDPITGVTSIQTYSPYAMQGGVEVGPSAEQKGALRGQEESTFLETAGDAQAAQAANVAGATEDARNTPGRQAARTREAVGREVETFKQLLPYKLKLSQQEAALAINTAVNKENQLNTTAAIKASAALMGPQFFDRVVDITRGMNDQEKGLNARIQGAATTAAYYMGGAPELKELKQLVSQNRRLLGQAFGVTEGNPSDKDMENVLTAIGIDQFSTTTERYNALRNLQDMISIGPTVASRLPANSDMATRMEMAKKLAEARHAAEDEAVAAGATEYNDPVTHSRIKVIQ